MNNNLYLEELKEIEKFLELKKILVNTLWVERESIKTLSEKEGISVANALYLLSHEIEKTNNLIDNAKNKRNDMLLEISRYSLF